MKPAPFPQANGTLLGGPAKKYGTAEDVGDLPVYRDESETISCWKMSWKERLLVAWSGRVFLRVAAQTHPPVVIETNPFL